MRGGLFLTPGKTVNHDFIFHYIQKDIDSGKWRLFVMTHGRPEGFFKIKGNRVFGNLFPHFRQGGVCSLGAGNPSLKWFFRTRVSEPGNIDGGETRYSTWGCFHFRSLTRWGGKFIRKGGG